MTLWAPKVRPEEDAGNGQAFLRDHHWEPLDYLQKHWESWCIILCTNFLPKNRSQQTVLLEPTSEKKYQATVTTDFTEDSNPNAQEDPDPFPNIRFSEERGRNINGWHNFGTRCSEDLLQ